MESIGIGITTRNRPDVLEYVCRQFDKYCPSWIEIVVVDDNSDDSDANRISAEKIGRYVYNERRLGVANSKNECIRQLSDPKTKKPLYDHIFLFDDDCFPTKRNWWDRWLRARENHLVLSPGKDVVSYKRHSIETKGGLGSILYLSKYAIMAVGGFDPDFGMWGFEHAELSNRIYRAKLTSSTYITPIGRGRGIHSFDYHGDAKGFKWQSKSSITQEEKEVHIPVEGKKFQRMVQRVILGDLYRDIWSV